jgi:hypothetical protein
LRTVCAIDIVPLILSYLYMILEKYHPMFLFTTFMITTIVVARRRAYSRNFMKLGR